MRLMIFILVLLSSTLFAQNTPITIDGNFTDWFNISVLHTDQSNDQASGSIDFRDLKVTNNADYLFLDIEVGGEISLLETANIALYIDTDNNSSTGVQYGGIGAELEFRFRDKSGTFYYSGGSKTINHSDINVYPCPTVNSNRFEIAFDRNVEISGRKLFTNNEIKIILKDKGAGSDRSPDSDGGISYSFVGNSFEPYPDYSITKPSQKYLRVMTYNIEQDGLFSNQSKDNFQRIFQAINPDVIGFEEIYNNSSESTASKIEEFLPSASGQTWYHAKAGYDIVLVSRYEIKETFEIFPKSGHAGSGQAMGGFLLDMRPKFDTDMLVITAHPKCCSYEDSDEKRQNQCDAVMEFVREAKESGGILTLENKTPFIIMGDMNFVGDNQQPRTIQNGDINNTTDYGSKFKPDWNYKNLVDAMPLVNNLPVTNSTNNPESSYPPGRLDYMFYTGSVLNAVNSFILYTPALTSEQLNQNNLQNLDTRVSDHLPVVVDFEMVGITDVKDETIGINDFRLEQNYPNPFNPATTINFSIPVGAANFSSPTTLVVYDILGNKINTLVDEQKSAGTYSINFNASHLTSGVYFYQIKSGSYSDTKKMVLLR